MKVLAITCATSGAATELEAADDRGGGTNADGSGLSSASWSKAAHTVHGVLPTPVEQVCPFLQFHTVKQLAQRLPTCCLLAVG